MHLFWDAVSVCFLTVQSLVVVEICYSLIVISCQSRQIMSLGLFLFLEYSGHNYWHLAFNHILMTTIDIWTVKVVLTIILKIHILLKLGVG